MLALVNWGGTFDSATGGTFQSDTDGTFHSDIPGTFESDMGGTFKVLQSNPIWGKSTLPFTEQAKRDEQKNSILDKAGIPLLRLTTDGSNEKNKIINALSR